MPRHHKKRKSKKDKKIEQLERIIDHLVSRPAVPYIPAPIVIERPVYYPPYRYVSPSVPWWDTTRIYCNESVAGNTITVSSADQPVTAGYAKVVAQCNDVEGLTFNTVN